MVLLVSQTSFHTCTRDGKGREGGEGGEGRQVGNGVDQINPGEDTRNVEQGWFHFSHPIQQVSHFHHLLSHRRGIALLYSIL